MTDDQKRERRINEAFVLVPLLISNGCPPDAAAERALEICDIILSGKPKPIVVSNDLLSAEDLQRILKTGDITGVSNE